MAGDESGTTLGQPHLAKQDLSSLDVSTLTPLSQEIISRQATINIGKPAADHVLSSVEVDKRNSLSLKSPFVQERAGEEHHHQARIC
uniref:Uncharacterized protein n=1 Tax=Acanthochromis polyacanthus TaxID=80966 RepID=A0A3Q1F9P0_9TELE